MDTEDYGEPDNTSFGEQIAKSFILGAVSTFGTVVGMIAIGAIIEKVKKVVEDKNTKNTEIEN